ncbi:MAG: type II toxin-antitoxin system VapC family toxin [Armatimonadetes bacterium]|nr:type II toxin-antitoxin system VapC family toxin [Armatimonadota bacterium]
MPPALLDTNILVDAAYRQAPLHAAAAHLVDRGLRERGRFCIAPQNLVEFAAVVSRPRFVDPPLSSSEIVRIVHTLYRSRQLVKIYPQRATVMRAIREGAHLGITGPLWYDLFLALTMQDAGVSIIITHDTDHFRRFPFVVARGVDQAGVL